MRLYICQDCGARGEHEKKTGCVPRRCADCRRQLQSIRRREWYEANREHAISYARRYWYSKTERTSTATCERCASGFSYEVIRGRRHALCAACRPIALRETKARYRERHRHVLREKGRAYARKRYATDEEFRRTALEHSRFQREVSRTAIYERDQGVCHICGEDVQFSDFEIDHVIPRAHGGSNDPTNLKTAHQFCNRSKGGKILEGVAA